MGLAQSTGTESAETKKSAALDTRIDVIAEDEARRIRVLVLGLPGSGKNTVIKQMRVQNSKKPYSPAERKAMIPAMHALVVRSMQTLIAKSTELGLGSPHPTLTQTVLAAVPGQTLTLEVAQAVSKLWVSDDTIRCTYGSRCLFPWEDSASYFFDKALEMCAAGWVPSVDDVVRSSRLGTGLGVVEQGLIIQDSAEMIFIDVSSQKNERKKWVHSFSNVAAVVFVASLADYDLLSDGDPSMNRLMDALTLYAETVNSRWFDSAAFFLLLNKCDVFEEKIRSIDLRHERKTNPSNAWGKEKEEMAAFAESAAKLGQMLSVKSGMSIGSSRSGREAPPLLSPSNCPSRFLDYKGGCFAFSALQYLKLRFAELARREPGHEVTTHIISAVDTKSMARVALNIKDTVKKHFNEASGPSTGSTSVAVDGGATAGEGSELIAPPSPGSVAARRI